MEISNTKNQWIGYEMSHYTGSLDFPCDFCGKNAYNNLHLTKNRQLEFVVCFDCINKVKEKEE